MTAAVLAAALAAATAFASKEVIDYFGTASGSGSAGGEFNQPRDSAVNSSGTGPAGAGDVYVADDGNHRIERFDSQGNFISAWGADVSLPDGGTDFEICTEAADCQAGAASGGNGTAAGNGALDNPQSVAVDGDTGNVYVSDRDNHRVNVYDGAGSFVASFGFDVDATEAATTYEVCPAANVCKAGEAGAGAGQVGATSTAGTLGIAVSPPDGEAAVGKLFLADSQNRRVNVYDLDGANPSSFGSATEFGATQPRKIAVDSRGVVYASNSNNGAEVLRYDSANANGGGATFLAPIKSTVNETQTIAFTGFSPGIPIIGIPPTKFTLTCPNGDTTAEITYATGATGRSNILNALENSCGAGNFGGAGNPPNVTVAFQGAFAGEDVPTTICTKVSGNGSGCSVSAETDGEVGALLDAGADVASATSGLAVDPDSDGAGADEDALYVLRDPAGGNTVVQQFGPANDPGLSAAPSTEDDAHGSGAGLSAVQGLGLDDASGRLFVSATSSVPGTVTGHRVYVLGTLPAPGLTIDEVTVKTDTTATFSGTVDPMGGLVNCGFQYSTNQFVWTDVQEPGCAALAPGGGPQAVSEEVAGLDPNTHYFVRLAASRPFVPASTATTAAEEFDTDAVPPVVSDVGAVGVTDTSARLVGTIDPRNAETEYVFRYGTTPALGSATAPLEIGGGIVPIVVSQVISGLDPDTDYHFELVATNDFGSTPSGQESFHTRAEPLPLPANRAYEMVTPPDKNLADAIGGGGAGELASVSRDGQAVGMCSGAPLFGEPPPQMPGFFCAPYVSRRGSDGWQTTNPFPPYCRLNPISGAQGQPLRALLDRNFKRAALLRPDNTGCRPATLHPAAPQLPGGVADNLYRQDLTTESPSFELLAPRNDSSGTATQAAEFKGGDDDFSHIVYSSRQNQTDPPDSPAPGDFAKLYGWVEQGESACALPGGCLSLISKAPGTDAPFDTESWFPTASYYAGQVQPLPSHVSADGDRIYFQNPIGSTVDGELYMREGGATTHHVSASECTVSCGAEENDEFLWANRAGDKAFFVSCAKLTDASAASASCNLAHREKANAKLYRWDRNAAPGNRLIDLSTDDEPADGAQAHVRGLIGASEDGETAFFVAAGQIVAGEPTFPAEDVGGSSGNIAGAKLYRWRHDGGSPTVDYLGRFDSLELTATASGWETNWAHRVRRVTPDGEHLLIGSRLRLDPAADSDADADVYRWSESDGWTCVSCQVPGVPSAGDSGSPGPEPFGMLDLGTQLFSYLPMITMSDDGQRIFFDTPDALVPQDVNGEEGCPVVTAFDGGGTIYACHDVYEWHDGAVGLISGGDGDHFSHLTGSTPSGEDVFFSTRNRLVGWDVDDGTDIYDARIGGGFPEPPPRPPSCEGEGCRGAGSAPPATTGAGSAVFQGPGNRPRATESRCGRNKLRRGKRCLSARAIARRRCRKLDGRAKRRCIGKQTRRIRRAQKRQQRRRAANHNRRARR